VTGGGFEGKCAGIIYPTSLNHEVFSDGRSYLTRLNTLWRWNQSLANPSLSVIPQEQGKIQGISGVAGHRAAVRSAGMAIPRRFILAPCVAPFCENRELTGNLPHSGRRPTRELLNFRLVHFCGFGSTDRICNGDDPCDCSTNCLLSARLPVSDRCTAPLNFWTVSSMR
jgi:hypothetical protein